MIEVKELIKKYGTNVVLNIPELDIPKAQSFGLVGNNGAGKTTLFSLLLDLVEPTQGEITIGQEQVQKNDRWKSFTAAYIDQDFLIGYLTPEEYFELIAQLRQVDLGELHSWLQGFESFFKGEILGRKRYIRDLSKGNQKKVGLIACLIGDPEVVILDEPFANLDPSSQMQLKELLKSLSEESQTTLLISSHDLNHITEVCERIVLLDRGEIQKDTITTPETLSALESYFKSISEH
ncbi:MAG: ABC transporter ATP-binding protein [Flavobacteriaceae bacterium]